MSTQQLPAVTQGTSFIDRVLTVAIGTTFGVVAGFFILDVLGIV